uniref:Protein DEK n=1 Tax=Timema poppense TaxID=170557 RepID=A0A7R9H858_TIMPO|nr:unnamed protein product [Timema poppensis]
MSVDRDSVKGEESKVEDVKKEELAADSKNGGDDKSSDDASEKGKKVPPKKRVTKAKEVKKEVKKEESKKRDKKHVNDDGGEGDDEDEAGDEIHAESGALKGSGVVPLLDQPLELQGTRDRKKVERFTQEVKLDSSAGAVIEIPEGRGDALGDIPIINAAIQVHVAGPVVCSTPNLTLVYDVLFQRARVESLKPLHKVLFTKVGKINFIKNNLKKFNGFNFDSGSDQFEKKKVFISKLQVREIRFIMDVLDLEKKGNREELSKRMAEFLVCPKDSGKEAPKLRSKRSSAIKAAKRGFSESRPWSNSLSDSNPTGAGPGLTVSDSHPTGAGPGLAVSDSHPPGAGPGLAVSDSHPTVAGPGLAVSDSHPTVAGPSLAVSPDSHPPRAGPSLAVSPDSHPPGAGPGLAVSDSHPPGAGPGLAVSDSHPTVAGPGLAVSDSHPTGAGPGLAVSPDSHPPGVGPGLAVSPDSHPPGAGPGLTVSSDSHPPGAGPGLTVSSDSHPPEAGPGLTFSPDSQPPGAGSGLAVSSDSHPPGAGPGLTVSSDSHPPGVGPGLAVSPDSQPPGAERTALPLHTCTHGGVDTSEEEEERRAPRARRPRAKISMKEDSGSESEEKITKTSSSRRGKKEVAAQEEDKISEEENEKVENESEDMDSDEPKSKKKAKSTPNSKKSPAKKNTPAKKGGGGNKKAEKKSSVKKRKSDDKSGEQSSSEDEPLSKKSKTPPTDEEIKSYVKEILEGANLEEITMKTVCKQVYSNYPDFDLAHKKDFIKTTVKSTSYLSAVNAGQGHSAISNTVGAIYNFYQEHSSVSLLGKPNNTTTILHSTGLFVQGVGLAVDWTAIYKEFKGTVSDCGVIGDYYAMLGGVIGDYYAILGGVIGDYCAMLGSVIGDYYVMLGGRVLNLAPVSLDGTTCPHRPRDMAPILLEWARITPWAHMEAMEGLEALVGYGGSGGYGGYGSYGGYGGFPGGYGMNRFGQMPSNDPENRFIRIAEDSTRPAFQTLESMVQAFGSVSFMMESTFHAVYNTFRAVMGVAEHLGRMRAVFGQVFSTVAVYRFLLWAYRKFLYILGISVITVSLDLNCEDSGWLELLALSALPSSCKQVSSYWNRSPRDLVGVIAEGPVPELRKRMQRAFATNRPLLGPEEFSSRFPEFTPRNELDFCERKFDDLEKLLEAFEGTRRGPQCRRLDTGLWHVVRRSNPTQEGLWKMAGTGSPEAGGQVVASAGPRNRWPIIVYLLIVLGGPYFIWKKFLSKMSSQQDSESKYWDPSKERAGKVYVMWDFQAASNQELSVRAGQAVYVAPKRYQPTSTQEWLLVSPDKQRMGLVPLNFLGVPSQRNKTASASTREPQTAEPAPLHTQNREHIPPEKIGPLGDPQVATILDNETVSSLGENTNQTYLDGVKKMLGPQTAADDCFKQSAYDASNIPQQEVAPIQDSKRESWT